MSFAVSNITKPKPGVMIDPFHPLSQGEVLHLLMNEGSGSRVYDISGHGNHGTLTNGPIWGGSRFGGGVNFDGSDDYVDCGNDPSLNLSIFTVAFWVKVKQIDPGWNVICGKEIYNNNEGYYFFVDSNWLRFTLFTGGDIYTSTKLNEFVHIVGTFDGSTAKLYENGSYVMQDSSVSFTPANVGLLLAARHQNDGSGYADTSNIVLDDFRIYKRVLDAWEVEQLYHDPFCNLLRVPIWRYYAPTMENQMCR